MVCRTCVRNSIDAGPSAASTTILLPTRVGTAEHASVAAGEHIVSLAVDGMGGRRRVESGSWNVSPGVAIPSVKIVPTGSAAICSGHSRLQINMGCALAKDAACPCVQQMSADLVRMDKAARTPPAMRSPSLARVIRPPAFVPWVTEPADPAPVQAHVESPYARRREISRTVPARIVISSPVDDRRSVDERAGVPW